MMQRTKGITVKVLDLTGLEKEALEWRQESRPECFKANVYGGDWAIVFKGEQLFALCTEGVGWEITDEDPLELEFHGNYHVKVGADWVNQAGDIVKAEFSPSRTEFDVVPFGSYSLSKEELEDAQIAAEVDLSDFIRTFGSRLESNFWNWFDELSKEKVWN